MSKLDVLQQIWKFAKLVLRGLFLFILFVNGVADYCKSVNDSIKFWRYANGR